MTTDSSDTSQSSIHPDESNKLCALLDKHHTRLSSEIGSMVSSKDYEVVVSTTITVYKKEVKDEIDSPSNSHRSPSRPFSLTRQSCSEEADECLNYANCDEEDDY
eukprot:c21708_g4_i2.p2 GENE.c21708_g4_i2~~c21708_g4_i2.p2  ORF type:complete len:105 (+),score=25.37 c21708_g4_i2:191-505(+)